MVLSVIVFAAFTRKVRAGYIRFLPQQNAFISEDGQLIKIPCTDGYTGEVTLGSYHDRASAILVAEAILDNGGRLRGVLMSGGITEIPIPKIKTP